MSRKVLFVKFHQGLFVPQLGNLGDTLPSMSKTIDSLSLELEGDYLLIEGSYRGIKTRALVPSANIAVMTLAPEEAVQRPVAVKPVAKAV